MILEDLKFRRELKKLQKAKQAIHDAYDPKIPAKPTSQEEYEEQQSELGNMFAELGQADAEISLLQHRYITKQAERLLLPVPEYHEKSPAWKYLEFDDRWRLTADALARLGREVRMERRERFELIFLWPSA